MDGVSWTDQQGLILATRPLKAVARVRIPSGLPDGTCRTPANQAGVCCASARLIWSREACVPRHCAALSRLDRVHPTPTRSISSCIHRRNPLRCRSFSTLDSGSLSPSRAGAPGAPTRGRCHRRRKPRRAGIRAQSRVRIGQSADAEFVALRVVVSRAELPARASSVGTHYYQNRPNWVIQV
jgi:hypothetical protein